MTDPDRERGAATGATTGSEPDGALETATPSRRTVSLGEVDPARSRHGGRRSAVALTEELVVVGTADGSVVAYDRGTLAERWRAGGDTESTAVVAVEPYGGDGLLVGERSPDGAVRAYDAPTGALRWRYTTATDLGPPQRASRFFRPFVAAVATTEDGLYVAARRYERDGDRRRFTSVVYRFDGGGGIAWRYRTDGSPIALAADPDGRRLAVAYNRCPGDHGRGLVVLDAETGARRYDWDPGTQGQRRVGDVALLEDGAVVASHADYRGYRLRDDGSEVWSVDLATPRTVGEETLYAYPNHVHATSSGAVFVTGNTYAVESRETEGRHPGDHTAAGYAPSGERRWSGGVGGFASEVATDGDRVAVPGAQDVRTRDPDTHGLRLFDVAEGPLATVRADGVVTAVSLRGRTVVAVEEPVVYHDEGRTRGRYRLLSVEF